MSRQLVRRLLQKNSLKNLRQGGTLSVKSMLPSGSSGNNQQVHLKIMPSWREDGHLSLHQIMVNDNPSSKVEAIITHEQDMATSMGRLESHVSVLIDETANYSESNNDAKFNNDTDDDGDHDHDTAVMGNPGDITLTARVPEKVNLSCELPHGGNISVTGKIEGDIYLITSNGNIDVTKLRGHNIHIETQSSGNTIYASDVLEAQDINIVTPGRIRAKRMHGTSIQVRAHGETTTATTTLSKDDNHGKNEQKFDVDDESSAIDISSLYVSGVGSANLLVSKTTSSKEEMANHRAVRVKSNHGHVSVNATVPNPTQSKSEATEPIVELGGVNGSCDVNIQVTGDNPSNNIKNNNNTDMNDPLVAGQIHFDSASPDSISFVTSNHGDLSLTLDRKLETDIRLVASPNITSLDTRNIMVVDDDYDAKDDSSNTTTIFDALKSLASEQKGDGTTTTAYNQSTICIDSEAFTERLLPPSLSKELGSNKVHYVDGWVENKSREPDSRYDVRAQQTTIGRVGKIRIDSAATQALSGFTTDGEQKIEVETERPLLIGATSGKITLENLSWLGAIARRYGLQEDGRELGRTASRSGRSFRPSQE